MAVITSVSSSDLGGSSRTSSTLSLAMQSHGGIYVVVRKDRAQALARRRT